MMEDAAGYYDWMMDAMRSHIGGHVLEVGCGCGVATPAIARLPSVYRVTAVDILPHFIEANGAKALPKTTFACQDFTALPDNAYDSVVCTNVLEHLQDDAGAAKHLYRILKPGGTLAFLVPAHPKLYTVYDHEAGHYRRYRKSEAEALMRSAGFRVDDLFSFNALGAAGWYVSFNVLQRGKVMPERSRFLARCFQRYVQPVGEVVESVVRPPFGLSVIALCTKK